MIKSAEVIPGLVSTIIPVYNRPKMIRKSVESVLDQTYRPIEIIIVDDGSTDDTPEVLRKLKADHPEEITLILKENGGPGLARETGRLIARGEFIQYLDSDDWLLPDKFEAQVKALQEHPECGIAYGQSRFVNEDGETLQEPSKWTGRKIDYLFPALLVDRWWHTHTPLYRKTVSDEAGPWPSQRPEDWDLESRMGALKVKLYYCDKVLSCQLAHSGVGRVSEGPKIEYLINEAWFLPRLYKCARKGGVGKDTPEMRHFSHWSFFVARRLGEINRAELASQILKFSSRSSNHFFWKAGIYLYAGLSFLFGWKNMNSLSLGVFKLMGRTSGEGSMPGSWSR